MSDPYDRSPMPGFPNIGSAHAVPPHLKDPHANQLRPAVSAADAERGNSTAFGPPAAGWPVNQPPLSPIKQRTIDGIGAMLQQAAPALPAPLQIGVGAMLGAVRQQVARQSEEDTARMLWWIEGEIRRWRTGIAPDASEATTEQSDAPTPLAE